jgi:DNA-binding transcriptional MerR regulator
MNDAMNAALTIQQAAARSGLSAHTLRYYERIGLIRPVPRKGNGHRRYRAEDMGWIAFLLRLRTTGMPVEQMQRYAALREAGPGRDSIAERTRILRAHAARVQAELDALRENLDCLHQKISLYESMEHPPKGERHDEHDGNEGSDTV